MSRHKQLKNIVKAEQEADYGDEGYYDEGNYGYNNYGDEGDEYDTNYMQTSNKKKKGKKGNQMPMGYEPDLGAPDVEQKAPED